MTRKAHELGMSGTRFVNASGLPDDAQITTARDLSILGRAVQERFPRYYHYFSTHAFYYAGATILNHNHLMDRVEGMDGIKTGYTRASGFNLLTSVKRDGRYIVAVVMGGASAASRDRIMAGLIEDQIGNARDGSHGVGDRGRVADRSAAAAARTMRGRRRAGPAGPAAGRSAKSEANRPAPRRPRSRLCRARDAGASNQTPKITLWALPPKAQAPADPVRLASIGPDVPVDKPRPAYVSGAAGRSPTPPPQMRLKSVARQNWRA